MGVPCRSLELPSQSPRKTSTGEGQADRNVNGGGGGGEWSGSNFTVLVELLVTGTGQPIGDPPMK